MAERKNKNKIKKYRIPLRLYFSFMSIGTLCAACLLACGLVVAGMHFFYHGAFTLFTVIMLCLLVCSLSMLFGGILLWFESTHLTRPIEEINRAVQKVAQGDFETRVQGQSKRADSKKQKLLKDVRYENELDELIENFNKMAAELGSMDYMRKDFMNNVSHEVKTPVAAIAGFSEILLDGGLEAEQQQEYLVLVNQEALRLSRLCENMLRMSKLDNQQIVIKKNAVRIDEQIRTCIIMLAEKWSDRTMNYELELHEAVISCDADLLMLVWTNLIDNAIKYSSAGKNIGITETCINNELMVSIRDEGCGIGKEKQPRIFDKFYQCEESHKGQGSGLGLSIVKRTVELLDGSITCESEEGAGTTMTVKIPL